MKDKMKKNTKNKIVRKLYSGIKIVIFFCILFLMVGIAAKVVQRKESVKKYSDFWELSWSYTDVYFRIGISDISDTENR